MANYIQDLRKLVGTQPLLMPGSTILVFNGEGEALLQHRADTKDWGLPGGAMELGESFAETAQRELYEETGLVADQLTLLTVLSGKEYYFRYPNGDETYSIIALFRAEAVSGELLCQDGESWALAYFGLDALPELEPRAALILAWLRERSRG